jgi:hypothetical protein
MYFFSDKYYVFFQDWTNSKQIAQLVYTEFFTQVLKCKHMYYIVKKLF